jgi:hypothetical protein
MARVGVILGCLSDTRKKMEYNTDYGWHKK